VRYPAPARHLTSARHLTRVSHLLPAAVAASAILLLSACSSGVSVPPPSPEPSGAAAYACAALHGRLPDEVAGATTTATKPQSPYTQAWGSPAIVLRCGVGVPAALTSTAQLVTINGVDWLPEPLTQGYLFTTVGRVLNIEVSVPDHYSPEADALSDLGPVIAALDPKVGATSASPSPS
jgi:hypothetical protein